MATTHSDTPGWRPDPVQPGRLRWWNGLDWSDAWRDAGQVVEREREAVQAAVRGSTITPQEVARTARDRRTERGAPTRDLPRSNPWAGLAPALGIAGLTFGGLGVISVVGVIVSLAALLRGRRAASRNGRSNLGAALAGLVLSALGVAAHFSQLLSLIPGLQAALNQ